MNKEYVLSVIDSVAGQNISGYALKSSIRKKVLSDLDVVLHELTQNGSLSSCNSPI